MAFLQEAWRHYLYRDINLIPHISKGIHKGILKKEFAWTPKNIHDLAKYLLESNQEYAAKQACYRIFEVGRKNNAGLSKFIRFALPIIGDPFSGKLLEMANAYGVIGPENSNNGLS